MQQAHQPQGWKQAGSEILRSLRVPRGVYREEKPPPEKASGCIAPTQKNKCRRVQTQLGPLSRETMYRKVVEEATDLAEETLHWRTGRRLLQA